MTDLLATLLEPLSFEFLRTALAVTVTAGIVCGVLSCWLVLVGWSLMGDAVSHAVLPGVVLAYVVGGAVRARRARLRAARRAAHRRGARHVARQEDAAIGVVFTTLFALGLVLISVTPSQTDLNHILFGNLLGCRARTCSRCWRWVR